jgi:hypothetical protein
MVDEVVVVDDHITGVVSEHQAGKVIGWDTHWHQDQGASLDTGPLFPGVRAGAGLGWHAADGPVGNPGRVEPEERCARPGLRLLMVSTTGEQYAYYVLDDDLQPGAAGVARLLEENRRTY